VKIFSHAKGTKNAKNVKYRARRSLAPPVRGFDFPRKREFEIGDFRFEKWQANDGLRWV
jgi:hypothetical protein